MFVSDISKYSLVDIVLLLQVFSDLSIDIKAFLVKITQSLIKYLFINNTPKCFLMCPQQSSSMRSPKWNMPVDATLPASVKSWLGQQLELRGIDAVIYTRYILSILQQDSRDLEVAEPELFPAPAAAAKRGGSRDASASRISKPKVKAMKRMEKRGSREVDLEELKKTAAVECLMSVSDEVILLLWHQQLSINCDNVIQLD